jgi:hypothetical protein
MDGSVCVMRAVRLWIVKKTVFGGEKRDQLSSDNPYNMPSVTAMGCQSDRRLYGRSVARGFLEFASPIYSYKPQALHGKTP